jgi:sulfite exporter TauE/SafE
VISGGGNSPLAGILTRLAAPFSMARGQAARCVLGILLGFLPCGLLYGALAAAGGTDSAIDGAQVGEPELRVDQFG